MLIRPDALASLAEQFRFHADYPLHQRLEVTAEHYGRNRRLSFSTPGERRAAVERFRKDLEALLADIPELDRVGGNFLLDDDLRQALARLHTELAALIEKLKGKRGGGSDPDVARRMLVMDLYQIYRLGTGRRDRYTQEPGTSIYSGPAIEFIQEAADQVLGMKINDSFIGETLKRARQRV